MEQLYLPVIVSVAAIVVAWLVFKFSRGEPQKSGTIKGTNWVLRKFGIPWLPWVSNSFRRASIELYIYPIKSTYGIQVQSATIGKYGFKYDREWMLVDSTNNFVSQRVHPKVCVTVQPAIDAKRVCLCNLTRVSAIWAASTRQACN